MHKTQQELRQAVKAAKAKVRVGGEYVHYKSDRMHYKVLDLVVNTDDDSVWVVYEAQYDEHIRFVRSLKEWLDVIETENGAIRRFTLIS